MARTAAILLDHRGTGRFREIVKGDRIQFLCNGRGRGGHCRVFAKVQKVNAKTIKAIELARSYSPGTEWTIHNDNDCSLFIEEHSAEWLEKFGDKPIAPGTAVEIHPMELYWGGKKGVVLDRLESEMYVVKIGESQVKISPSVILSSGNLNWYMFGSFGPKKYVIVRAHTRVQAKARFEQHMPNSNSRIIDEGAGEPRRELAENALVIIPE